MPKPLLQQPSWPIISLKAVDAARAKAALSADGAGSRVIGGIILLLVVRLATGLFANTLYDAALLPGAATRVLPTARLPGA